MVFEVFSIQSFILLYCTVKMNLLCWNTYWNRMVLLVFWSPSFTYVTLYQNNIKFKAWLQTGGGLKYFLLQVLYEKTRLQTGAVLKHSPLQILYEKARLQTGAGLKHLPLQMLYKKLWKGLITDWSWSAPLSLTNPSRKAMQRLDYSLELLWSNFFTNPLRKSQITDWSCSEASSFTNPLWKS